MEEVSKSRSMLEKKIEALWIILLMVLFCAWMYTIKFGLDEFIMGEDIHDFWKKIQSLGYLFSSLILGTLLIVRKFSSNASFGMIWMLFFIMLIGAGEEANWGQLWFNFDSPAFFNEFNWEHKINFHDVYIQGFDVNRYVKIILKIFIVLYASLLPLAYHLSNKFRLIIDRLWIPVPPLSFVPFVFIGVLIERHYIHLTWYDFVGSIGWDNAQEGIKTLFSFIMFGTLLLHVIKWKSKPKRVRK